MFSFPRFHVYRWSSRLSRFDLYDVAANTVALKSLEGVICEGEFLILLAEQPERFWASRSAQGLALFMNDSRMVLICAGAYELVNQAGFFSDAFLSRCHLYTPGEPPLVTGISDQALWYPESNGAEQQNDPPVIPCFSASEAFVWNALQIPGLKALLDAQGITTWDEFCHRYSEIEMTIAIRVASVVERSVREQVMGKGRATNNVTVIADSIITLAQAMPPWNQDRIPVSSVRITNALQVGRIRTVADLRQCNPVNLVKLPNFGQRSLKILLESLADSMASVRHENSQADTSNKVEAVG